MEALRAAWKVAYANHTEIVQEALAQMENHSAFSTVIRAIPKDAFWQSEALIIQMLNEAIESGEWEVQWLTPQMAFRPDVHMNYETWVDLLSAIRVAAARQS